jgi:putative acetyltransferase
MPSFSTRRLRPADMDAAAAVYRISYDDRLPWLAGRHTPEGDKAFFRTRIIQNCEVWGASDLDRLVGFIAFRSNWIDQLYVLPDTQGRGVGMSLLRIAQTAYPMLHLWTFQRNLLARRFYEARGFLAIKETDGEENEAKEPDVLYRWIRPEVHL